MKTLNDLGEAMQLSEYDLMILKMEFSKVAAMAGNIMAVLQSVIDVEEAAIAMGLFSLPRTDVASGMGYGEY